MAAVLWRGVTRGQREAAPSLPVPTSPCAAGLMWSWDPGLMLSPVTQVLGTGSQVGESIPRSQSGRGARIPRPPRPQQTGECLPTNPPAPTLGTANRVLGRREGQLSFLPRWRPELSGLAQGSLRGAGKVLLARVFTLGPQRVLECKAACERMACGRRARGQLAAALPSLPLGSRSGNGDHLFPGSRLSL